MDSFQGRPAKDHPIKNKKHPLLLKQKDEALRSPSVQVILQSTLAIPFHSMSQQTECEQNILGRTSHSYYGSLFFSCVHNCTIVCACVCAYTRWRGSAGDKTRALHMLDKCPSTDLRLQPINSLCQSLISDTRVCFIINSNLDQRNTVVCKTELKFFTGADEGLKFILHSALWRSSQRIRKQDKEGPNSTKQV